MKTTVLLITASLLAIPGLLMAREYVPDVGCKAELDRGVLPAGGRQTAVIKITLDPPRPPRDAARPSIGDTDGDDARRRRERTTRTDDARTVDAFSRIDDRRATRDGRLTEAVGTTRARSEQL